MSCERSCVRVTRSCSVPPTGQTSFLSSCFHGRWLEFLSTTFVRVKLASFLLWLAACQNPKPQPLVQHPCSSPPKIKPNSNSAPPSHPERSSDTQTEISRAYTPKSVPPPATLSTDPHHHSHRHKPLLPPCTPLCLQSKGTGSSREVKCSLQALSYAPPSALPTPSDIFPPRAESRSAPECRREHSKAGQRGGEGTARGLFSLSNQLSRHLRSALKCEDVSSNGLQRTSPAHPNRSDRDAVEVEPRGGGV